jgi:hypothetical protein
MIVTFHKRKLSSVNRVKAVMQFARNFPVFLAIFVDFVVSDDVKFLKIQNCTTSGKFIALERCEIVNNRLLFIGNVTKPLTEIVVKLNLFKRSGKDFQKIFDASSVDWCQLIDGKKQKINPFARSVINSLRPYLGEINKPCPYTGMKTLNVSVERKIMLMYPSGVYKAELYGKNRLDDLLLWVSILFEFLNYN